MELTEHGWLIPLDMFDLPPIPPYHLSDAQKNEHAWRQRFWRRGMYTKEDQLRRVKKKTVKEYDIATERARKHGFLVCEGCNRSLLDGQENRHHILPRSWGGKHTADNLAVLCADCHGKEHGC